MPYIIQKKVHSLITSVVVCLLFALFSKKHFYAKYVHIWCDFSLSLSWSVNIGITLLHFGLYLKNKVFTLTLKYTYWLHGLLFKIFFTITFFAFLNLENIFLLSFCRLSYLFLSVRLSVCQFVYVIRSYGQLVLVFLYIFTEKFVKQLICFRIILRSEFPKLFCAQGLSCFFSSDFFLYIYFLWTNSKAYLMVMHTVYSYLELSSIAARSYSALQIQ